MRAQQQSLYYGARRVLFLESCYSLKPEAESIFNMVVADGFVVAVAIRGGWWIQAVMAVAPLLAWR